MSSIDTILKAVSLVAVSLALSGQVIFRLKLIKANSKQTNKVPLNITTVQL
jgi:hypothetical protein